MGVRIRLARAGEADERLTMQRSRAYPANVSAPTGDASYTARSTDERRNPAVQSAKLPSPKWADMTRLQRITYVAKVVVCVLTFGMVFPGISAD